jgi:peroxiredoxin
MVDVDSLSPLQPGDHAPNFTVPMVDRDGTVALADYRGIAPILLGLFRGTYCPFCRRAIVRMAQTWERLKAEGVEALAIVATTTDNARLCFRFHPPRLPVAADPEFATHRLYRVPGARMTEIEEAFRAVRVNPTGELPAPLPVREAFPALNRLEGFRPTPIDREDAARPYLQLSGSSSWTGRALSAGRTSSVVGRVSPGSASSRLTTNYWLRSKRSSGERRADRCTFGLSPSPLVGERDSCRRHQSIVLEELYGADLGSFGPLPTFPDRK